MRPPRLPLAGALVGLVLAALTGCGSSAGSPRVASVPDSGSPSSSAPTHASTATGSGGHRPVLRLDDSQARIASLWNAYSTCLLQHGARKPAPGEAVAAPGGRRGDPGVLVHQPPPARAKAACVQHEPEGPLELDASTNPRFHDQSLAYVGCLRSHGEYVRLLNDHDIDWTYVAGHSVPDDNAEIEHACLVKSFGGS